MRHFFYWFLLIISLGGLYGTYNANQKQKNIKNKLNRANQLTVLKDREIVSLNMTLLYEAIYSNQEIPFTTKLIDDEYIVYNLKDIIMQKPVLVLRYTELSCSPCVDSLIYKLDGIAKEIGYDRIVLLAKYKNLLSLSQFKRVNNFKWKVFNTELSLLDSISKQIPYIFILSEKGIISHLYFVTHQDYNIINDYFTSIKKALKL